MESTAGVCGVAPGPPSVGPVGLLTEAGADMILKALVGAAASGICVATPAEPSPRVVV